MDDPSLSLEIGQFCLLGTGVVCHLFAGSCSFAMAAKGGSPRVKISMVTPKPEATAAKPCEGNGSDADAQSGHEAGVIGLGFRRGRWGGVRLKELDFGFNPASRNIRSTGRDAAPPEQVGCGEGLFEVAASGGPALSSTRALYNTRYKYAPYESNTVPKAGGYSGYRQQKNGDLSIWFNGLNSLTKGAVK
jgi:hypothetical protein